MAFARNAVRLGAIAAIGALPAIGCNAILGLDASELRTDGGPGDASMRIRTRRPPPR